MKTTWLGRVLTDALCAVCFSSVGGPGTAALTVDGGTDGGGGGGCGCRTTTTNDTPVWLLACGLFFWWRRHLRRV
jgi:hypothetical protein